MIVMDLKGGSWVGVYQKFEAMCAEVEEVICEDTLKYVENQVRTVGVTVKKFYADVTQDLHHQSSLDSVNSEDPLLTVVHHGDGKIFMNPKVDDKIKPVDAASEKMVKDFNCGAACDDSINYGSCDSAICSVIKTCKPTSNNSAGDECTQVNSESHGTEPALSNQSTYVAKNLDCKKDSQNNCLSDFPRINATVTNNSDEVSFIATHDENDEPSSINRDAISKEASEVSVNEDGVGISWEMTEGYGSGDVVKEKKTRSLSGGILSTNLDISSMKADVSTTITSNVKTSLEVDRQLCMVDIGTSIPFFACEFKRRDADKKEVLVSEQLNEVKLGESCVLVEKNDHSSKLAAGHVQKSYKKKIQDVFTPKRWSKRKQDQEQIAIWYEEQSGKNLLSTSTMLAEIQKSQVSESFDSDWELL